MEYLGNFLKLAISISNSDKYILDNLCPLSSQKYNLNHTIIQVIVGWANRISIIQIIPIDITVRIHIPRTVITAIQTVTHIIFQDYLS